jgi:ABC-type transporter Mla MlaB component
VPNQVVSDPGKPYVELRLEGDQNRETVNSLAYEVLAQLDSHKKAGKPAWVLVDLEKVGKGDPSAFHATLDVLNTHGDKFERMAEFGATNPIVGRLTNYAIEHLSEPERFRYFSSRHDAESWLTRSA